MRQDSFPMPFTPETLLWCYVTSAALHMQHNAILLGSDHAAAKTCRHLYVMFMCNPNVHCRLLLDQDFPPQCVQDRGDLCKRLEAGLEIRSGFAACARHHQVLLA